MKEILNILKSIKQYKKWLLMGIFFMILEIITELITPIITSNTINIGIKYQNIDYIIQSGIIMIFLSILSILGGIFSTYFISKTIGYTIYDIRKKMLEKLTTLSFKKLEQLQTGKIVTLFTNDLSAIQSVFLLFFRIFIKIPFIFIGSIGLCIMVSFRLSYLLLIILPILIIFITWAMKKAYPYFEITQDGVDEVNCVVRENIDGVRVVKSFTNESYELKRFDKVNKKLKTVNIQAIRIITLVAPFSMLVINLGIVGVLWFGGNEVVMNRLEIGEIVAFIQYLNSILTSILTGSLITIMLAKSRASILRIEEILKSEEELKKDGKKLTQLEESIQYINVTFKYQEGSGDNVLKDINFSIPKGSFIGIVGPTGSGKSTLVKLLAGFFSTFKGSIQLDNQDYYDYNTSSLRSKIEYVSSTPEFFSGTIEENLKFGNPKVTKKQMLKALESAHFYLNHTKKDILQYKIEQKAKNLSGGEKQRLGLARAILKDANIILLDDCFSAIDYKTTSEIQKNIKQIFNDKTIFWITNRISNIENSDSIIVLEDGKIDQIDTHENLLKKNSFYQTLYHYERSE